MHSFTERISWFCNILMIIAGFSKIVALCIKIIDFGMAWQHFACHSSWWLHQDTNTTTWRPWAWHPDCNCDSKRSVGRDPQCLQFEKWSSPSFSYAENCGSLHILCSTIWCPHCYQGVQDWPSPWWQSEIYKSTRGKERRHNREEANLADTSCWLRSRPTKTSFFRV